MPILVVCQNCKKSFQVNEKFAGKSGPCPKCKATIKVPEKAQEVKVHGGEDFATGGRNAAGKLVLKPIVREQTKFRPAMAGAIGGVCLAVIVLAWLGGRIGLFGNIVGAGIGLLLVSPLLVMAAYTFLYDDELEPYRGMALYARVAACAATYMLLWAAFAYLRGVVRPQEMEAWMWVVIAPPFFVVGTLAGWFSFDLEPTNGFFHYTFYLLVTMILGWLAGMGWPWM
jgi:hypothetical protein